MKAVVLVAGVGSRLRPLTDSTPKGLIPVAGRPMLDHAIDAFRKLDFEEVILVTGYLGDQVEAHVASAPIPCRVIYNPRYDSANNYYSLLVAREAVAGHDFVKVDADLVFRPEVLEQLLAADGDLTLAMDSSVELADEEMKVQIDDGGRVVGLAKTLDPATCAGESIGMERVRASVSAAVFEELAKLDAEGQTDAYYEEAYHRLAKQGKEIRAIDVSGLAWCEIDDVRDLEQANTLFGG